MAIFAEVIGAGRILRVAALADRHAAADVLPQFVDHVPRPQRGVEIPLIAGRPIVIEIGLEAGDQIAVRVHERIFPDGLRPPGRQTVDPPIADVILLGHLQVFRLADGREISWRAGDVPLMAIIVVVDQLRQHVPMVEPIGVAAEQGVRLRVAGDAGVAQAVGEPRPAVVRLLAPQRDRRKGEDITVRAAAGLDAVDQLVHALAEFRRSIQRSVFRPP